MRSCGPHPVAILACEAVADDWHARFSCLGRAYEYRIVNRRAPLTWERGLAWQVAAAARRRGDARGGAVAGRAA